MNAHKALLEESAEDLYEHAPCGYLSTQLDGLVVRVNETLLSWTGYTRDGLVGRMRFHDLLAPGARIFYETHYAPLLQMQGSVREIAIELVCADGRRLPALVNSVLRRDEQGTPQVVRTTVFDASDRRRYERELLRAREDAEARARAALALAHVNEGVLLVSPEGRVELLSPAGEAVLGVDGATLPGRLLHEALPEWAALAERVPLGERDRWPAPVTLPLARADGERWVAVAGVDSGEGVVYTFRDVTAERRLDELRDDVVAVVSHELRTPLAGAYGAAKTLLERSDVLDETQQQMLLELVVGQSERMNAIVEAMLLSASLHAGRFALESSVFDAAEVVGAAVAHAGRDPEAAARLQVEATPGLRVRGDRARTEQALRNLIDNALKYAPAETPVYVRVRAQRGSARFMVADEGPGVPSAERERLFERFHRADPYQRGGGGGVGLGLSIARELVLRMDGRIGLLPSERGATFFVDLPLAPDAP